MANIYTFAIYLAKTLTNIVGIPLMARIWVCCWAAEGPSDLIHVLKVFTVQKPMCT